VNTRGLQRTTLHHGDCRKVLASLSDASVDSVVTDPPYELGFMGKAWDASGIAYSVAVWSEVLRVLKPGGHLLAFGGTRTYHRMACAIEDAGFEIRDSIHWLYGSGFPKSLDVSKAIDKAAGAKREVIGTASNFGASKAKDGKNAFGDYAGQFDITAPATAEASRWEGWGTALKPAHEPVVVARKPLVGTVAANVLAHGTGALNIDGCRVGAEGGTTGCTAGPSGGIFGDGLNGAFGRVVDGLGRWPANVVLDPDAAAILDGQSGDTTSSRSTGRNGHDQAGATWALHRTNDERRGHDDSGGASRFFTVAGFTDDDLSSFRYVAKPDKAERNVGLDGAQARVTNAATPPGSKGSNSPRAGANRNGPTANFHPTVKPLDLMRWLVRLVTPLGGTVLDPFAGSGTTLAAGLLEGFTVVGIELTDDYLPIIEGRCHWAERQSQFGPIVGPTRVGKGSGATTLFDEVEP
jgi:DNA modification methylase